MLEKNQIKRCYLPLLASSAALRALGASFFLRKSNA
jgi:hypothetical protein